MIHSEVVGLFSQVKGFEAHGYRAPHKPLLLLFLLGKLFTQGSSKILFDDIEPGLKDLFRRFGRPGTETRVNQPFWHLQSSPLWQLENHGHIRHGLEKTARFKDLRSNNVTGSFPQEIENVLKEDWALLAEVAQLLLDKNFPISYHEALREACNLPLSGRGVYESEESRQRDKKFRIKILASYKFRCCFCGYKLILNTEHVGLEAAHIKWFSAGGPDDANNGLALCSLHHTLFDRGALTLLDDFTILASKLLHGDFGEIGIDRLKGKRINTPESESDHPEASYLQWHRKQVFNDVT